LLSSEHFDGSTRSREFLQFVVEETLAGRGDHLNQAVIAMRVFGRKGEFDAMQDPVVRVQAGRLRRSLEHYYLRTGDKESLRIELHKGSYAPVFATAVAREDGKEATLKPISLTRVAAEWPRVMICPFEATDPQDHETVARIGDQLGMELYRHADVRVVHERDVQRLDPREQASVRFELRGRLRRQGEDCVVSARLIDRSSGSQVWGDEFHTTPAPGRWSSTIDDVARVIAAAIGSEQGAIIRLLAGEHRSERFDASNSVEAILSCYHFFTYRPIAGLVPAVESLQRVIVQEPETALAWAYLARLYQINYAFELTELDTPIDKSIGFAYQALLLEPKSARIRCILASSLMMKGETAAARDEIEQSLRLNPESLVYRELMGWVLALSGDWDRGMSVMRDAMARNPYCLPQVSHGLWADQVRRGDYQQAYTAALEYRTSAFFWRELMIACCLGHLGRTHEARLSAAELLRAKPNFAKRGRTLIGYYIKAPELRERIIEGLRKAGLTVG
jgi:adenylate cyclase